MMDVVSFSTESSKRPCGQMTLLFQLIVLLTPIALLAKHARTINVLQLALKILTVLIMSLVKMASVPRLIVQQ